MRYLSVCSGIEAASVAWHDFGWTPVGFSEIDKGPSRVLAHHYGSNLPGEAPSQNGVPNFGDFTKIPLDTLGQVDLLVGGTPCQAFSVAGKRMSLDDARGNLTLSYVVLAHELARSHGCRVALWENVPGVLSTKDNAFGCFLGALVGSDDALHLPKGIERWPDAGMVAGPRARVAWRLLDAQYFGLAQRRRRVFVVASFGGGPDPAAILLERQGVRRHPPTRGEAGEGTSSATQGRVGERSHWDGDFPHPTLNQSAKGSGGVGASNQEIFSQRGAYLAPAVAFGGGNCSGPIDPAATLTAKGQRNDFEVETFCVTGDIAHTLKAEGFDASEDGTGRGQPIVAHAFDARQSDVIQYGDMTGPLDTDGHTIAVAFSCKDHGADATNELAPTMRAMGHSGSHANAGGQLAVAAPAMAVRRLMPRECERLQGFPDDHTLILKSDGPRYKALGNSMAVPVMRWIGQRIDQACKKETST